MPRGTIEVSKSKVTPRTLEASGSFKDLSGHLCIHPELNFIQCIFSKDIMQREFFCGNALEGETKVKKMRMPQVTKKDKAFCEHRGRIL